MDERALTLLGQWAANANTVIPVPPVPGFAYRNVDLSADQVTHGQDYNRILDSATYNELLYMVTGLLQYAEQYGIMPYSPNTNYPQYGLCMDTEGAVKQALQPSGPDNGGAQPTDNVDYWSNFTPKQKAAYEVGEIYGFLNPTLKPGFQTAYGGILNNASVTAPVLYEFLQTPEGQLMCVTESAWQTLSAAAGGVGGAWKYVLNTTANTIRLPDVRGDYCEFAGFDGLSVGGWHGDAIREITGRASLGSISGFISNAAIVEGVFTPEAVAPITHAPQTMASAGAAFLRFRASLVVPTANKNQPRAGGVIPCVYVGEA